MRYRPDDIFACISRSYPSTWTRVLTAWLRKLHHASPQLQLLPYWLFEEQSSQVRVAAVKVSLSQIPAKVEEPR
jgi:hypothetical protein